MSDNNVIHNARIPIIPDLKKNTHRHMNNELVFDPDTDDLYIKKDNEYINITGSIRENIHNIQDGSSVIHICTEDTLPDVSQRLPNHWYFVVLRSSILSNKEENIDNSNYVYYGIINFEKLKSTDLLISQNMISTSGEINLSIPDGFNACLYVPVDTKVKVKKNGSQVPFTEFDNIYIVTLDNKLLRYNVYINDSLRGDNILSVELNDKELYTLSFNSNIDNLDVVLPEKIKIPANTPIGEVVNPKLKNISDNGVYQFLGWSNSKNTFNQIKNISGFTISQDTTIYAYYTKIIKPTATYNINIISEKSNTNIARIEKVVNVGDTIDIVDILPNGYQLKPGRENIINVSTKGVFTENIRVNPIEYKITYNFGLILPKDMEYIDQSVLPTYYDVESSFSIPEIEFRNKLDNYYISRFTIQGDHPILFVDWDKDSIEKGTTGDITIKAMWTSKLNLADFNFRSKILSLHSGIIDECKSIKTIIGVDKYDHKNAKADPTRFSDVIEISNRNDRNVMLEKVREENYKDNILYIYYDKIDKKIYLDYNGIYEFTICTNYLGMFATFTKLVGISGMYRIINNTIPTNVFTSNNIKARHLFDYMFDGCTSLNTTFSPAEKITKYHSYEKIETINMFRGTLTQTANIPYIKDTINNDPLPEEDYNDTNITITG